MPDHKVSNRDELLHLFREPSPEYGEIATWFWETGRLTKEQLTWQLEELADKGTRGTWFYPRYCRSEPYGTHPAYFTEEWWDFVRHSLSEHRRLGVPPKNFIRAQSCHSGTKLYANSEDGRRGEIARGARRRCVRASSLRGVASTDSGSTGLMLSVMKCRPEAYAATRSYRWCSPPQTGNAIGLVGPSMGLSFSWPTGVSPFEGQYVVAR